LKFENGIVKDRDVWSIDWSRSEVVAFHPKNIIKKFSTLEKFAEVHPKTFVILESTGESYELQRRAQVLEAFKKYDVEAWSYNPKYTARYRQSVGVEKTTDEDDAHYIYLVGTTTKLTLKPFTQLARRNDDNTRNDGLRNTIKDALVTDRYLYNGEHTMQLAAKYIDTHSVPKEYVALIFTGKKFKAPVGRLLQVAINVKNSGRGYREFRRQVGNYGQGYPSMARSEFYFWWVGKTTMSKFKQALGLKKKPDMLTDEQRTLEIKIRKEIMKMATSAMKWLWRLAPKTVEA
jgi:hypothetical protein